MVTTFSSEEERNKALNEISTDASDAPVGMSIDDFLEANEKKIDEIMSAEIVENSTEENLKQESSKEIKSETNEESEDQTQETQETQEDQDVEETQEKLKTDPSEIEYLERRNEALKEQNQEIANNNAKEIEALKKQIEELKNSSNNSTSTKQEEENLTVDSEISTIKKQIDDLENYMNRDDLDMYDEEYAKKSRELNRKSLKLTLLLNKRNEEIVAKHKREIEELKQTQKAERDNEKQKQNREKIYKSIESFRETVPELKGRKYEVMDEEYTEFAKEVAAIWYGTTPNKVNLNQAEIAVNKFMNGNPEIIERCKSKGLRAPEGLEQYMVLSDVNALRSGHILDKSTGEWTRLKDVNGNNIVFPDLNSAWDYYQRNNNLPKKLRLDKENQGAKQVVNALNKRANIVELDEAHTGDISAMSKEQAQNIINTVDEDYIGMKARRNFDDPEVQEYNKALGILEWAQLVREDFE